MSEEDSSVINVNIPQLVEALRTEGASDIMVIAGGVIPPKDYDQLHNAGVALIFGPGTNIIEAAQTTVNAIRTQLRSQS